MRQYYEIIFDNIILLRVRNKNYFSYFSTKTYVVGTQKNRLNKTGERSGSVVECLTRDRRAAGSSLTGVTALWSLSKTHLS